MDVQNRLINGREKGIAARVVLRVALRVACYTWQLHCISQTPDQTHLHLKPWASSLKSFQKPQRFSVRCFAFLLYLLAL